MSGNVAPPFCYCWTHFWSTSWSSNYAYDISFQSLGSQESSASNSMRFGGEMKKLWPFEDKRAKLSENFAAETPFVRVFRSCETNFWHTSAICSIVPFISKLRYSCEITYELRNHFWATKWLWNELRNQFWAAKSLFKLRNGCEITSKHRKGLQIPKLTCEMEEGLQKHFAKLRKVAKMPIEPCNHAYEEESHAHPGITHMKPFTPFQTS